LNLEKKKTPGLSRTFKDAWEPCYRYTRHRNNLSTLATIVADFGDNLSPKMATVAENGDSRRCDSMDRA